MIILNVNLHLDIVGSRRLATLESAPYQGRGTVVMNLTEDQQRFKEEYIRERGY
jgi:hypothetical protein